MAEEKEAFFVVKKGDVIGVYKSLSDIQPLLASSVSGEPLSVFKGYSLPQKTEEYLVSHGLKGARYSIGAADVHEGLFAGLVKCPYQEPPSYVGTASVVNSSSMSLQGAKQFNASEPHAYVGTNWVANSSAQSLQGARQFNTSEVAGSSTFSSLPVCNIGGSGIRGVELSTCLSCTLMFDGASKGNPGPAGAGAVLRAEDGSKVYRLREGVGTQTNNFAEYRGLILGLKHAIKKGYKHIQVKGDSLLVCNQVKGLWKIKNQNIASLCNEAKELKNKFLSFDINHVLREYNSEADVQANLGINLQAGQVEEDIQFP